MGALEARAAIYVLLVLVFAAGAGCNRRSVRINDSMAVDGLPSAITNSIGMELALIPPGEFLMGSPRDHDARDGSQPQHHVQLTRPFYMGAFEVTQDQYFAIMDSRPSHFCDTGVGAAAVETLDTGSFPVDRVTWEEAVEFCARLTDLPEEADAGRSYRLPTEAEWEYACRAGTTTPWCFGDSISGEQANINTAPFHSQGRTTMVGSYPPNAFGLHDMHGNVWEWCGGGKRVYSRKAQTDPVSEPSFHSVIRGGAWDYPARNCRSDHRGEALSGYVYFGFRVFCELDDG